MASRTPLTESDTDVVENELVEVINARRDELDEAPPVEARGTLWEDLRSVSREHAEVMASVGTVAKDLEGSPLVERLEKANSSIQDDAMRRTFRTPRRRSSARSRHVGGVARTHWCCTSLLIPFRGRRIRSNLQAEC